MKDQLIIGSTAMKYYYPDFPRIPKDLDIVSDRTYSENGIEYLYNPVLPKYQESGYLLPDLLLTLKVSHLFYDIKWEKHMFDVQFLLKKGCKINMQLFEELYAFWQEYHPKNHRSNLNMSAKEFFDNAIEPVEGLSHDELHLLINPNPTFQKVLIGEVLVSEDKFNNLSFEDKCNLVYEEVEIMAYERYRHMNHMIAYSKMLKKFIISHAPIWEALFIIENYILLHKARQNFIEKINNQLPSNKQLYDTTTQF